MGQDKSGPCSVLGMLKAEVAAVSACTALLSRGRWIYFARGAKEWGELATALQGLVATESAAEVT